MSDNAAFQTVVNLAVILVVVIAAGDLALSALIVGVDIAGTPSPWLV